MSGVVSQEAPNSKKNVYHEDDATKELKAIFVLGIFSIIKLTEKFYRLLKTFFSHFCNF